jgi:hypothetical protein
LHSVVLHLVFSCIVGSFLFLFVWLSKFKDVGNQYVTLHRVVLRFVFSCIVGSFLFLFVWLSNFKDVGNRYVMFFGIIAVAVWAGYLYIPVKSRAKMLVEDIISGKLQIKDEHVRAAIDEMDKYETMSPAEKREFDKETRKLARKFFDE